MMTVEHPTHLFASGIWGSGEGKAEHTVQLCLPLAPTYTILQEKCTHTGNNNLHLISGLVGIVLNSAEQFRLHRQKEVQNNIIILLSKGQSLLNVTNPNENKLNKSCHLSNDIGKK